MKNILIKEDAKTKIKFINYKNQSSACGAAWKWKVWEGLVGVQGFPAQICDQKSRYLHY